ncbi:DEAD/DEAH box helicase [Shewanella gaetbuli]|uniref:DEAD/DEAH box helicase n=1 Tax=Shewanella gaetbuli TaxID=220752 RepID=A0A9X1ZRU7_9GAMM|nr:DEAD/DEAH box helicase [Shewanella gaetbuli]MCL1142948.1 DEAD/DEAH box helicase [Shewanella gaetbuli]
MTSLAKVFKPFAHQEKFASLWGDKQRVLNFDGCGTGKTLSCVHAVKTHWPKARVLVLAPLSILECAWVKDLNLGWPEAQVGVASVSKAKKIKVFEDKDNDWVITNHDTVKLISEMDYAKDFDVLIVDEGDAFRNRTTQRSKAIQKVAATIPVMTLMTGTPSPKSITDVWHLAFLIDRGQRLGRNFFDFRSQVCTPSPVFGVPNAMKWDDKPEANQMVTLALADICSRVSLQDVQELPETIFRDILVAIPPKLRREYESLRHDAMMMLQSGQLINAVHAGAKFQKLLQTVSGAIYDERGNAHDIHKDRHELVIDLASETDHCLVAFNWTHQRDGLIAAAKKRGLSYAVIDGEVSAKERTDIVNRFQKGLINVLFAHPQSAGHGLTLTKANRVIWASPTYRADLYEQFNHRIVRTGQKRKTEIINITAEETVETDVYAKLMTKKTRMGDLLDTFKGLFDAQEAA